jgi:hypothetical protein
MLTILGRTFWRLATISSGCYGSRVEKTTKTEFNKVKEK